MPWALAQAETALEGQLAICAPCHGVDGKSTMAGIPSLAAQPETFLVTQLILFREKLRKSEQMAPVAAKLDDAMIEKLAAHFAALPPVSSAGAADPALMKRGRLLAKGRALRSVPPAGLRRQGADSSACRPARRLSAELAHRVSR